MKRKIIITATVLLFLLFLYTAFSKLLTHDTFVFHIKGVPFFGQYANVLAWAVPELEILIACLLIIPKTKQTGLFASFFLLLFFTVYIYWLQHFTNVLYCSCGGILGKLSWTWHFWFNIFFTLLAAAAVCLYPDYKKQKQAIA